ncbi:efflux RND transporter permease subunit [Pseudaquidulcibacter saccharophilus]|uniref:efflux RND transporter permease subunit n=1 Tax=Pseudaquidulcibacter saccharophilus TaxID=2831900 RepID=UPI001EFEF418|nr:efflux RND transporter permease subunit [Pseudaquidulcibacter saccharophilus]
MRNISSWAIKNPIVPIVLFFIFTILGMGAFFKLPINSNPDIDYPAFSVDISMPGAAPSEIENQITQKVEGALTGIEGVKKMTSTAQTSHSSTFVELQIGTDISKAVDDARAAVAQIRSDLPADIYEPTVSRVDFNSQDPVGIFALRAPTMADEDISWFIDNEISRQLLSVKGVGQVNRFGGATRQITVDIDPNKLNAFGGSVSDVSRALRSQNIDSPGGVAETGAGQQSIRTLGSAGSVEELRKTPITLSNGRVLRLDDIADVRDGASDITGIARYNDSPVIMFQVLRAKSASGLKTYHAVMDKIAEIEKAHPDIKISTAYTPAEYIQSDYDSSLQSLLEGALLATLVVSVFLGGWRVIISFTVITGAILFTLSFALDKLFHIHVGEVAVLALLTLLIAIFALLRKEGRATFLAAMAIPLSTIPTFYVMQLMGFTLNGITLLALGLVAGILVDDAIVEIENIERHIDMGKRPYPAALEAADEIGLAVVATTSTIVAVFVPVSFMTGIVGQFFKSFGITVAVAVLCSLAVARLITPLMAAYLMVPQEKEHKESKVGTWYLNTLKWALANRWKTFGIGMAIMLVSLVSAAMTPKTFMPDLDDGLTQISIDLPPGLTPMEADKKAREVSAIILDQEGTKHVVQSTRGDLTGSRFFVTMTDRKDRSVTKKQYEAALRSKISQIPGIRSQFGGGFGGGGVSISLVSNDPKALEAASKRIMGEMRKFKWAVDLKSSADLTKPELHIIPRREEAARLGVNVATIASAIRLATDGDVQTNLPKFNAGDRQIPILVRLARENRADIESIKSLRVATGTGASVPLSAVADVEYGGGQARVERENRQRVVTISAGLGTDENGAQMQLGPAFEKIKKQDWYKNPGPGVSIKDSGDAEDLADMMSQFLGAILLGVFLVYCVLVLLFKDFLQPITIVSVILLAPAGAFLGLFLVQAPLSITSFIGLLMLIGIATKNSILLVDFAVESINKGMPRYEALIDAALKRSRPIIMTSIAMIAGMMPNALTSAGPGAFRQGMAIAVIGGLTLSTALSLIFVPAVYTIVDDFDHWIRKFFKGISTVTEEDKVQGLREEAERKHHIIAE